MLWRVLVHYYDSYKQREQFKFIFIVLMTLRSNFWLRKLELIMTLIVQDDCFFKEGREYGMIKILLKVNCRIFGTVSCFGLIEEIRMQLYQAPLVQSFRLILIVYLSIGNRMAENGTRKGERSKKPPRYLQYDEAEYSLHPSARPAEQKEKQVSPVELGQIARLLAKLTSNINQRLRDYSQIEQTERIQNNQSNGCESQNKKGLNSHINDNNTQKPYSTQGTVTKRGKEGNDRSGIEPKNAKNDSKKTVSSTKLSGLNIQTDLQYHNMLNQHIRLAYPNISNITTDMLKGLDIPRQLLEQQNLLAKSKEKEEKSKMIQTLKQLKAKEVRQDLKPFKRQSYHVAIAYHIHLKNAKNANKNSNEIDPTFFAKRLRESQGQGSAKK